jgi:hypothetical protein
MLNYSLTHLITLRFFCSQCLTVLKRTSFGLAVVSYIPDYPASLCNLHLSPSPRRVNPPYPSFSHPHILTISFNFRCANFQFLMFSKIFTPSILVALFFFPPSSYYFISSMLHFPLLPPFPPSIFFPFFFFFCSLSGSLLFCILLLFHPPLLPYILSVILFPSYFLLCLSPFITYSFSIILILLNVQCRTLFFFFLEFIYIYIYISIYIFILLGFPKFNARFVDILLRYGIGLQLQV